MLDRFSHFFFRKEMDKLSPRQEPGLFSDNNRVLYLIDGREENLLFATEKLIDKRISKKLVPYSLILGHQMMDAQSQHRYCYTEKDITWKGIPTDDMLSKFIAQPFFLMIVFAFIYRRDFEYIIRRANCKMKIGPAILDGMYDLDIEIDLKNKQDPNMLLDEIQNFCPDIIHYEP